MKKLILTILSFIVVTVCFGQTFGFPSILPGLSPPQIRVDQGSPGTTTGFTFLKNFADTSAANIQNFIRNQPGITIMVNGYELWMRDSLAKSWVLLNGAAIDNNQWFGTDAFATYKNGTLTTATQNLAIGKNVMQLNIVGIGSTGVGFNALAKNDSDYNTMNGYIAGRENTKGYFLTGTGAEVLLNNTTGYRNTGDGYKNMTALTIGHDNTNSGANGFQSLTTGISNTGSGSWNMLNATIASFNVSIGDSSNFGNVAGIGNVDAGYQTGSSTGGNYNIRIGWRAGNHPLQMATPINSISIGTSSYNTASNQIVIGDSAHTDLRLFGVSAGSGNATIRYDTVTHQAFYGSPADVSANNGLTDSSGRIVMGGSFYKTTIINAQQNTFGVINGNAIAFNTTTGVYSTSLSTSKTFGNSVIGSLNATGIGASAYAETKWNSANPYSELFTTPTNTSELGNYVRVYIDSIVFQKLTTNQLSSSVEGFRFRRYDEFSPAAAGFGLYMSYYLPSESNVTGVEASRLETVWSDATFATRTSQFNIYGINSTAIEPFANFQTAGIVRVNNLADTLSTKAYVRLFNASLGATIYTADDALTGNRIVDLDGNNLSFINGATTLLSIVSGDAGVNLATPTGHRITITDDIDGILLQVNAGSSIRLDNSDDNIKIVSDAIFLESNLGGTVNGYVWTLTDNATGEGAWVISSGGGGGSVNSVNVSGGTTGLTTSGGPVTTTGTITIAGTLIVANGGTNITSYAIGDLIYASGATTLSKLADVAAGSYLRSGGVTTAPLWSTLILPNTATANQITYVVSTNTYGGSANLTFDGNIFTQTSGVTTGTTTTSAFVGTYNSLTSGTGGYLNSSSITSGNILQINSTGTAKTAGNEALDISVSGAIATNAITVTGGRSTVTTTNATSGTNIAFATRASGATTLNLDLDMGIAGTAGGHMRINGLTSGGITMQTANAAGTWTWTIPTDDGANNYDYLATDGSGVTRWQAGFNPTAQTLTDAVSITWNVNSGGNAQVTLGAAGRTLAITNPVAGYTYTIRIIQDGTGSRTITTWPTGTKWPNNGTAPTLTTTASHYDIVTFYYDGTNYYGNYNFDYQ